MKGVLPVLGAAAWIAATVALAGEPRPGQAGSAEPEWFRVGHVALPLSFEVPGGTTVRSPTAFSLGTAERKDRRRVHVVLYGVGPLERERVAYDALQFGFVWLTAAIRGADPAGLAELRERVDRPEVVEAFVREVFYRGREVELVDRGREEIDGYPARRTAIRWTVASGTRHERVIEGEMFLITFSRRVALAVIARYDPRARPDERGIFARIARSVRIGREPPDDRPRAGVRSARPRAEGARGARLPRS